MPQFLQLMTTNLLNINKGLNTTITIKTVTTPADPPETVKSGDIQKSEYLSLAQVLRIMVQHQAFLTLPSGKLTFKTLYIHSVKY